MKNLTKKEKIFVITSITIITLFIITLIMSLVFILIDIYLILIL